MRDESMDGCRVLVAEDEYMLASDLADALEQAGAHVIGPAPTVEDALSLLEDKPIDFAVLDVNLSGDLVYPLADALVGRGISFMFATGYDANAIPSRYDGVPRLEKPVDPAVVVRAAARSVRGAVTLAQP
ncbi:response regulator [Sphingomonas radiodurans]|uniref:response regulator n=1 Tax=Sphingomonas radiodurans TaxID=2890321 RepID=UPI001E2C2BD3|nr:response regulator [Sphingomonas radiodurans]WBH16233.1 response regulator [Sphingomonas radiodurans]